MFLVVQAPVQYVSKRLCRAYVRLCVRLCVRVCLCVRYVSVCFACVFLYVWVNERGEMVVVLEIAWRTGLATLKWDVYTDGQVAERHLTCVRVSVCVGGWVCVWVCVCEFQKLHERQRERKGMRERVILVWESECVSSE